MITIANRGPLVAATNYWATAMAARGLFYLTFNAGAARLLVPGNSEVVIRELRKRVQHVVVSFGPWFAAGNAMSVAGLNNVSGAGGTVTNNGAANTLTLRGSGTYAFSGALTATAALTAGLETVPPRVVRHGGITLEEVDLAGVWSGAEHD